jgi:Tol biopolymer transport system component
MNNSASDGHVLSADGRTLLFSSRRSGNSDIWSRDLVTARETSVLVSPAEEHLVSASADVSTFVYYVEGPGSIFLGLRQEPRRASSARAPAIWRCRMMDRSCSTSWNPITRFIT